MGDVIWGHDFSNKPQKGAKDTQIRTQEDAIDHLAAEFAKMLEEGDTLWVVPVDAHTFTINREAPVEPPADCPA